MLSREQTARLGPEFTGASFGADGHVNLLQFSIPPQPGRTVDGAWALSFEAVRKLAAELGLTVLPDAWEPVPGGMRIRVAPRDGLGTIDATFETRPAYGPDWHGLIRRNAITGVHLGTARLIPREVVLQRMTGRRYCLQVPTGQFELRRWRHPCDPVPHQLNSCRSAESAVRVPKTELTTFTVDENRPMRADLQAIRDPDGTSVRLVWALSLAQTPSDMPPDILVDAFTGTILSPLELDKTIRIATITLLP